jgi:hypothetical protein
MALPNVRYNFEGGKKEIAEMVTGIGKAIFTQARGSFEAAAKTVIPNVKQMVAEITEDLSAGPVDRFKNGLENLDKLINEFGVDLGKYSKDLEDFLKLREEKSVQSEKTVNELRTQNIIAQVNEFGEVAILTKTQIEEQKNALIEQNKEIKDSQKIIEQYSKIQQKGGELTEDQNQELITANKKVIETTEQRAKTLETLNLTEAEDKRGFFQKLGDDISEYVPDGLSDVGSAFTEGLMAPINAVKDLGKMFGSILKFGKNLPKLLKGFAVGLMGALMAMLPYLLIAGAIVIALIALKKGFDFVVDNLDIVKQKLSDFGDAVMAIPGKIADFFTGIFAKVKNFFIDAINGVIDLINKFKPGKDIEKIAKDPVPGEIDTTAGDQDAAFTAGNLDQRTTDIESNESGLILPSTTGDEGGGLFSKFKNFFKSKPANTDYMPVDTQTQSSGGTIIDNSVKTVNQNNQNQSLGLNSRNDDVSIRLSDAAA